MNKWRFSVDCETIVVSSQTVLCTWKYQQEFMTNLSNHNLVSWINYAYLVRLTVETEVYENKKVSFMYISKKNFKSIHEKIIILVYDRKMKFIVIENLIWPSFELRINNHFFLDLVVFKVLKLDMMWSIRKFIE